MALAVILVLVFSMGYGQDWQTLNGQSLEYYAQGKYEKAIEYADQALEVAVKKYGIVSEQYINSLSNKAYAESGLGDHHRATEHFRKVVNLSFKQYPISHVAQVESLYELAKTYVSLCVYDSGTYYINEGRYVFNAIYKNNKAHYDTALYDIANAYFKLNSLDASLHHRLGQYNEAVKMLEAQVVFIKDFYPDSYRSLRDYQITINNLCSYSQATGNMVLAKDYALHYYQLIKDNDNVLDRINALQNLGSTNRNMGQYDSAFYYWNKTLTAIDNSEYLNTPIHTSTLNNIGELHHDLEEYDSAIFYLSNAIQIQEKKAAIDPYVYLTTRVNLAATYHNAGHYPEADKEYAWVIETLLEDVTHNFTYLSDDEKLAFYKNQLSIIEAYTTFALDVSGVINIQGTENPYINPGIPGTLYNLQLTTKALILNSSRRMRENILSSGDTTLIKIYSLWQQRKDQLAQEIVNGKKPEHELKALRTKIEENEKWLVTNSRSFRTGFAKETVAWQHIQRQLKKDEAAIEIIRLAGGLIYGALILTPETKSHPKFSIVMSRPSKFLEKESFSGYKNAILFQQKDNFSYAKYWQPIIDSVAAHMPDKKQPSRIYLSNDGIYNQLNINTLYDTARQEYVIDQTEVVIVSNTKELLKAPKEPAGKTTKKIVLFGEPRFSTYPIKNAEYAELPGTGKEVKLINEILQAANWKTELYKEEEANEFTLKELQRTNVLHLASHGFFKPSSEEVPFSITETLMQSGIALAGVNDSTHTAEDGILTAYEVMNLPLDSTELVVLSACETAQGVNNHGEGVYGLQRAFSVAGVNNLIMSLWKVDDEATQKLMVSFYKNWIKLKDMRKAFTLAQKELREDYPSPYYWGAFVLTGI
ncbi:CHAT domain-containing protein [Fulvivirga lutimaris]|uniref:CHAT domain-containing protein n=1 Tax=Fulvivirga lutimaris TaxID=1819566 RepID=UPI0012BD342D|nr:CHAT domain-containing protein [Fulvivirga lutimaris]MTI40269.1 CHAT domain-containing protein [Fulvivirga lutimaris]